MDAYRAVVYSVMSQLLVSGPASPFYKSLIESHIGSQYTPNTGLVINIIGFLES